MTLGGITHTSLNKFIQTVQSTASKWSGGHHEETDLDEMRRGLELSMDLQSFLSMLCTMRGEPMERELIDFSALGLDT